MTLGGAPVLVRTARRSGRDLAPGLIAVSAVVLLVLDLVRLAAHPSPTVRDDETAARTAASRFLDDYVTDEGRVVRHDQGGDTVSEGQAWGLLLAVAADEPDRARRIRQWTVEHLRRDDGLLSWRWADGEVVDDQPASDADLTSAYALRLGAERLGFTDWRPAARRLADAIARHEVVVTPRGPLLVAGPWASESPWTVNPSYLWPRAMAALARDDATWREVDAASRDFFERLTSDDTPLAPDWTEVDADGTVRAVPAPGTDDGGARHGFDAARVHLWLASDCDPATRRLAASAWPTLEAHVAAGRVPAILDLSGGPLVDWEHPVGLVGAAATAHATGETEVRDRLLDRAAELDAEHPSYYGAALVALGRTLLQSDLLGGCDPVGGR